MYLIMDARRGLLQLGFGSLSSVGLERGIFLNPALFDDSVQSGCDSILALQIKTPCLSASILGALPDLRIELPSHILNCVHWSARQFRNGAAIASRVERPARGARRGLRWITLFGLTVSFLCPKSVARTAPNPPQAARPVLDGQKFVRGILASTSAQRVFHRHSHVQKGILPAIAGISGLRYLPLARLRKTHVNDVVVLVSEVETFLALDEEGQNPRIAHPRASCGHFFVHTFTDTALLVARTSGPNARESQLRYSLFSSDPTFADTLPPKGPCEGLIATLDTSLRGL